MKKIIALTLAVLTTLALTACATLQALTETTTAPTTTTITIETTTPETTIPTTQSGVTGYVYTDMEDLISQMYADIYAEIYADLYADLSADILAEMDEEIYAAVMARLQAELEAGVIAIPMDAIQAQIDAVVELSTDSVVGVTNYLGVEAQSLGSGVVYHFDSVANRYYLITNQHVVEGGDNWKIVFEDGTSVAGTLLGVDEEVDIAILSFSGAALDQTIQVSPLGDSDALVQGTIVIACGHPQGYEFFGSVTLGVVAGTNRSVDSGPVGYIQHDASINSGNSGGPLYNLNGEVIGINVSKYADTEIEGMGFAIPIAMVIDVIQTVAPGTLN